jgi:hypothetical protein
MTGLIGLPTGCSSIVLTHVSADAARAVDAGIDMVC